MVHCRQLFPGHVLFNGICSLAIVASLTFALQCHLILRYVFFVDKLKIILKNLKTNEMKKKIR
jgi:hypothetical protein